MIVDCLSWVSYFGLLIAQSRHSPHFECLMCVHLNSCKEIKSSSLRLGFRLDKMALFNYIYYVDGGLSKLLVSSHALHQI